MKFQMVETVHAEDDIEVTLLCRTLEVSKSGYYAWRNRPESIREQENRSLLVEIREIHAKSRGTYGSPRITEILRDRGRSVGENRVAQLMQENGIQSCVSQKFKVVTTDSNHDLPIAPRVFEAENATEVLSTPNQAWAGDISVLQKSKKEVHNELMTLVKAA